MSSLFDFPKIPESPRAHHIEALSAEVSLQASDINHDLETWSNIEPIRDRWKALETSGVSTPFQSFSWVSSLFGSVGTKLGAEPYVVIVKDRASGEDLLLLPLLRRWRGVMRVIEMPDFGSSDYNSPIISRRVASNPHLMKHVWHAAMSALPGSDLVYLQKIPEILSDTRNPLIRFAGMSAETYSSWQLALPEDLSELEQKTLSSATRRQIRRRTRQLEGTGDLRYFVPTTSSERKAVFDILRQQRQARFEALGRNNILVSKTHSDFYDRIMETGLDPDVLTVHALKVGDETIATAFGLFWQKRFYLLMSTMASGKWLDLSPGIVMIWKLIAHMHAKGCTTFDFTIGDEPYKRQLGATECTLSQYFRATSPIGGPYALGLRLRPSLAVAKRRLKKVAEWGLSNVPRQKGEAKSEA